MDDSIAVVVLTSFSDEDRILDALDAGAIGYLLKGAEPADLVEAVRAAARGESPLHPKAARVALARRATSRTTRAEDLTERERAVLLLVVRGHTNAQIGRRLGISERTVKGHSPTCSTGSVSPTGRALRSGHSATSPLVAESSSSAPPGRAGAPPSEADGAPVLH